MVGSINRTEFLKQFRQGLLDQKIKIHRITNLVRLNAKNRTVEKEWDSFKRYPTQILGLLSRMGAVEAPYKLKLLVKLLMFTPMTIREAAEIKVQDLVFFENLCTIQGKFLVFTPLIKELEKVRDEEAGDEYLLRDTRYRKAIKAWDEVSERNRNLIINNSKRILFKDMNEPLKPLNLYRIQSYFYLLSIGQYDIAELQTRIVKQKKFLS